MKILLINYEFPPIGGGAGGVTQNIAKELAKLGHEIKILTSSFENLTKKELKDGYQVIRTISLRSKKEQSNSIEMIIFVISAIFASVKILKKWRPDKTIAFFSIPSGIVSYFIYKIYKINYVISLQAGDVPGFDDGSKFLKLYHWLTLPLNKIIWKKSNKIIANSCGLQNLAKKTADKIDKQVKVIPNGVDLEKFKPNIKKKNNNIFRILFVGRLVKQKRVEFIIKAVYLLIKENKELKNKIYCKIIGEGHLGNKLKNLTKDLKLDDVIEFSSWIDRECLPSEYQKAKVFILPSINEGMPLVVLEALASGLPIIATRVYGSEELVKDSANGMLISNEKELMSALLELIKNKNLREVYGQKSLELSKKYSWKEVARQYLNILG